jgi:DNA repair protein RadD
LLKAKPAALAGQPASISKSSSQHQHGLDSEVISPRKERNANFSPAVDARPAPDSSGESDYACHSLRPHQTSLIGKIDISLEAGIRHLVAQAPTGFGKTIVGATLAKRNLHERRRTLFTVPALSLIDQTVEKFYAEGIRDIGVIQANHDLTNWSRPVQIASVQTLMRRQMPPADMVIIDEVHRWYDAYAGWLAGPWKHIPVVGFTATPWTRGLGKHFSKLIVGATTRQLIDTGFLSPFRVFAPASPDLSAVRTVAGDYRDDDLSAAMDKSALVADVVTTWIERGQGRPTLCFAVDRAHAKHLQQRFLEAGVETGYVDAYSEINERKEIARQFHAGEIKIVCNVGVLTTGIDWDVRCIILARPTKSEILFVQMVGRGLRTADGKDDCLILDHSDNTLRLGFVTDIHHDALDDGKPRQKAEPRVTEALPKKCPACSFLKPPKLLICPACGFKPQPKCQVVHKDGELVEFTSRSARKPIADTERIEFYQQLKHFAAARNYKPGWIAHKYREKFGDWPSGLDHLAPMPPTPATLGWIRSRQIAFAMGRR